MKKTVFAFAAAALCAAFAAPRRVALVVQNHCSGDVQPPMSALANTLAASLSGSEIRIVNPSNAIGTEQNREAKREKMPDVSVQELGRLLGADGVLTASVQEFTSESLGIPPVGYRIKARMTLSLADAATGETICGTGGERFSRNYTAEQVKEDNAAIFEGHLHAAAERVSKAFLAKLSASSWGPAAAKTVNVYFGCNVLGADVQIDGLSRGTAPAQIAVSPGVHTVLVSYPPYYRDFSRRALFDADGQTFAVVLQITPEGEKQRRSGEMFEKQKALADAELQRYKEAGSVEDYVRKTIADGVSVYWKNSCGRIIITDGSTENIDFATPKTESGVLQKGLSSGDIGKYLRELLEMK